MAALHMLDTAIGVILVFLLVSLICSALREIVETMLRQRARDLECGIRELLDDPDGEGLARELYNHPLVHGLFSGKYAPRASWKRFPTFNTWFGTGGKLPSYLPPDVFARALLDLDGQGKVHTPAVAGVLRTLNEEVGDDIGKLRENVEQWFNSAGDRIGGSYKRRTQKMLFVIGLVTAIALNINTIAIADELFHSAELRATVTATAEQVAAAGLPAEGATARATYQSNLAELNRLAAAGLPMGWGEATSLPSLPIAFVGWLLTALAVTMGAPFWFDMLNKVMVFRSTVKPKSAQQTEPPPPQKPDTPSADGQVKTIPTKFKVQELVPAAMADNDNDDGLFEPHEWENKEERGLL
jgi:hypothetical protein